MNNISFLGGSGYICNSIRNHNFEQKNKIKFYSRRSSNKCIKYKNIEEIPKSKILFDLSQWANGRDIDKYGTEIMRESIFKAMNRCDYYIFISTLSIDINNTCKYPHDQYSTKKLEFERLILSLHNSNAYILRIPSCFNKRPKSGSLIKLLFDRVNGSDQIIKQPYKFTSGIDSEEIFDFFKILIKSPDRIPFIFGEKKLLCLGDGFAYQIIGLENFLKNFSTINFEYTPEFIFPDDQQISLIKNCKWNLQPISFPVKLLYSIMLSKQK